ncbi:MAG: 16S rRNA (guanine(966)-N(2))-methyltransferase RsmD [Paenibacillus sp.]|uniref:16S rRNA (Guanine(966)-N(2))-methyltransferase RsmD n=1 Tax=Paenibacillus aquistagni TaxID=1852522 RepID=A0A1X7ILQ4_9BACL|nr:16S rRNA (guanine(966)-N(2))-methyltransferase RsmD [Paenibacillus aquistagni]MBR2569689.1 16S rRNA (guanine(966)-N(2))-methyltransferase RsmD [Paenibacillus sp.]NMM51302.1 16S rRNA (guanine(966)-N(2))-methyltransferase RsmD [Paenibacillus aquistagni]SMG15527.1 16S rRNA (guanine(966)-N(2))-methyltransferase RsmD [Paenibacillus aquistagni]
MRVISGSARGRTLKAVPGMNTRPTTDKVKEALFSMIGPYFEGGVVLDLFAGTGGLGIEAISRGMDKAIFIDMDTKAIDTIRYNVKVASVESKAEIYRNDAKRALKVLEKRGSQFDLVFMDPPYRYTDADQLLATMIEGQLLGEDAVIVIEHDSAHQYPETIQSFTSWKQAKYGDTTLSLYRRAVQDSSSGAHEV